MHFLSALCFVYECRTLQEATIRPEEMTIQMHLLKSMLLQDHCNEFSVNYKKVTLKPPPNPGKIFISNIK